MLFPSSIRYTIGTYKLSEENRLMNKLSLTNLLACTTLMLTLMIGAQKVLADEHQCHGSCKDKKECHCDECKCEKDKECSCDKSCKAGSCSEHHHHHKHQDDKKESAPAKH